MTPGGPAAPLVTVVGLGPGGAAHLSEAARAALLDADVAYLRTARHPSAEGVGHLASFDHHYDEADTFDQVYERIVEDLVEAAAREAAAGRSVVYGVPGSPLVAEATVEMLRRDPRVQVEIVPALSFLDLAWAALGVDPLASGVQLCDGTRFEVEAAGRRGPFLVAQCWSADVLSRVKLAVEPADGDPPRAIVLHHLGLEDEVVAEVPWDELDRSVEPDHLTSLWIDRLARPVSPEMARLEELVRTLRERCPWDREQTHASLTRHLIEETYEVLDAIGEVTAADGSGAQDSHRLGEAVSHLEEELGDLLFQVVFHSRLAAEQGWFTLADVARGVHDKLVGRHPHVFGDVTATTPSAVMANWEVIKAAEKGRASVTDGIPTALPALLLAAKMQRKEGAVGLAEPTPAQRRDLLVRALDELAANPTSEVLGDVLYALVGVAGELGVDPEEALRAAALGARDRIVDTERSRDPGSTG
ncbi:MAG TPA: MazG family protein [Acidimicrobiales bacterium]|nr:MazG family protein [Acidimicrobiales bacterium]